MTTHIKNILEDLKIEVTYKCPLACIHCSSDSLPSHSAEISKDKCLSLIEEAANKLLISKQDHLYQSISNLINLRSGYDKLLSYRSIKRAKQLISGVGEYDSLGF